MIPEGLIGPRAEVLVVVNGHKCIAILDSGSQVTILFKSLYKAHFEHLPLYPLSGLGLCGLSQDQYSYSGHVRIRIKFPASVAGVDKEVVTIVLVWPDPGWRKRASLFIGTNSSIFQVLAKYCRQQADPSYQKQMKMHALCSETYARWEKRGMGKVSQILGALHFLGQPLRRSLSRASGPYHLCVGGRVAPRQPAWLQ